MNILMYDKQFQEPHISWIKLILNIDSKTANVSNSMSKQWISSKQLETQD